MREDKSRNVSIERKKRKADMKVRKRRTERSQPLGPMVCRAVHSLSTMEQRTEREWPNEEAGKVPVPT